MVKKPNPNKRNKAEQRSIGNEKLKAVGTAKERGRARNKKRAFKKQVRQTRRAMARTISGPGRRNSRSVDKNVLQVGESFHVILGKE